MSNAVAIDSAIEKFKTILTEQLARIETMKQGADWINLDTVSPLIIGICGGDDGPGSLHLVYG